MSKDPYDVLGLAGDADDEAIRLRYLELVRLHPPEQQPDRFAEVRAAYDALKDLNTRIRYRFFERGRQYHLDVLIEEATCRSTRRRVSLDTMLQVVQARY